MVIRSIPPITSTGGGSGQRGNKKRLRSADPVRFRGRKVSRAENQDSNDWKVPVFKKPPPKKKLAAPKVEEVRELELEIFEEKDCVKVIGDMPGVEKKDIQCQVDGKTLKVHTVGKRKYEEKEIELPASVNQKPILKYKNGILEIELKKKKKKQAK